MAILNLTDFHHVGRPPFFLASCCCTYFLGFLVLGFFFRYGRLNDTWYAVVSISSLCRQSTQQGFPSLGTLEPRDIGTPSRSTGTLEPRDIGAPSAQGGERAPTRGTVFLFQVPAARFIAKLLMEVTTSWVGALYFQVNFLVSFSPRLQGEALSFNEEAVFNTGVNAPKRRLMPFEQRLMPLESFSELKGMKVIAFSEDFA